MLVAKSNRLFSLKIGFYAYPLVRKWLIRVILYSFGRFLILCDFRMIRWDGMPKIGSAGSKNAHVSRDSTLFLEVTATSRIINRHPAAKIHSCTIRQILLRLEDKNERELAHFYRILWIKMGASFNPHAPDRFTPSRARCAEKCGSALTRRRFGKK